MFILKRLNFIRKNNNYFFLLPIFVFIFLVLPFIIFRDNSIITIHDNLDSNIPWFKYIRYNKYFFDINVKSSTLDNLSTMYFAGSFTLYNLIYYIFNDIDAFIINYLLTLIISFISTYILLKIIFIEFLDDAFNKFILIFVSTCYACIPSFYGYRYAVASLPLFFVCFYYLHTNYKTYLQYLILFILPFISDFASVLVFICGLWFIFFIIFSIKDRKINYHLFLGLIIILVGIVISNYRLFYMRLFINEPLNRNFGVVVETDFSEKFINTLKSFYRFFAIGYYHSCSKQGMFILPIVFISLIIIFIKFSISLNKNIFVKLNEYLLIVLSTYIFIICIIIAIDEHFAFIKKILNIILPPLAGLNFTRLYVINNLLWYILFATAILFISSIIKNKKISKIFSILILIGQLFFIIFCGNDDTQNKFNNFIAGNNTYQDTYNTIKYNLFNDKKHISYKEFFDTRLFDDIKNEINYNGEIVLAFGYHPAVLMYNGFNQADGYISTYPYRDAIRFRDLIMPELNVNDFANWYYNFWYGRRYLYNRYLSYSPTKEKCYDEFDLNIDIDVFKKYYNGKYIISRGKIKNVNELNLSLIKNFDYADSIYNIYVYKVG